MFIRQNIDKWSNIELMVDDMASASPDEISEGYEEIMTDLSFAQTHFPGSRIEGYLNRLALALHHNVYRHHAGRWRHALRFWTHEIPLAVYDARRCILTSLAVFLLAYLIGVVSTFGDDTFPDYIMGRSYMEMTRENIEMGVPMGVYGNGASSSMFFEITLNNVRVSFFVFVLGVFTSIFPGLLLLRNGVMVGTFQTFFYQQHLLGECLLATMLHGTLELSAIVIAGGAGILLGNGWLFPGTYSRPRSFLVSARKAVKVLVSTLPVFMVAAFIEGYLTRYVRIGDGFRLILIGSSALFIIFYYILLPIKRHRESNRHS